MSMHKDSVQIVRSRVTLAKSEEDSRPYGVCLDSVQVEGVFQTSDTQPSPPTADGTGGALAKEKPPALVEVNITSRRLVIIKGQP